MIAEPIKRLGKYTFADALSAKFGKSKGITFAAAVSTLVVSVFYLIPQMVGAGSLVTPLLGIEHYWGVIIVGGLVILIVVTAGMVSTTYVQFIKGSLLVLFCAALVVGILNRGIVDPDPNEWYGEGHGVSLGADVRGGQVNELPDHVAATGPLGPLAFVDKFAETSLLRLHDQGSAEQPNYVGFGVSGSDRLTPGGYFKGIRSPHLADRLDFVSLMLALFCGTAALPHILIRYYTVKDAAAARKSTVTGIVAIGMLLHPDALHRPGRGRQRQPGPRRQQQERPAAGGDVRATAVRGDLRHRVHDGPGHGQRPDPRRRGGGGARPWLRPSPAIR